ncbi:MAG: erythromycin esterase family protein [Phycisphaerales bacterium]|nr:MAG: erythromycin esterase family protein [Phycisphaerales bacterium]
MRAYLARNSAVIPSGADGSLVIPAGIFEDTFGRYEVILTGESHGMAINYALRRAFLSYLKEAAEIKYLLLEMGPSQAGTLNRYLETGDTALLDEMYSYLKGTYEWTRESYTFWRDVYTFNRALPPEERLICVGIDIEHQVGYALAYLRTLLPDAAAPERIGPQIDLIRAFTRDDTTGFNAATELSASIEANEGDYKRYLDENFFEFRLIVESMVAAREAYRARKSGGRRVAFQRLRDATMYANFVQLYDRLPAGRYWGHFGGAHIFHMSSDNTEWFGAGLERDDSPVGGRVLSIFFAYERCTAMTRNGGAYGTSSAANVLPGLFDFYGGSEPVLFKLTGDDSPARLYQAVLHSEPGGSAEYFDYLLLIRDATPTRPLRVSDDED